MNLVIVRSQQKTFIVSSQEFKQLTFIKKHTEGEKMF